METDYDQAIMRESFSLVQNILFIDYTVAFPASYSDLRRQPFGLVFSLRSMQTSWVVLIVAAQHFEVFMKGDQIAFVLPTSIKLIDLSWNTKRSPPSQAQSHTKDGF